MADYLRVIITSSFFCTLIMTLLSENGVGKSAKAIVNIVMLCIIVIPILKGIANFSNNLALPVINTQDYHISDSREDETRTYREWLAKVTSQELSQEIAKGVKEGIGISVRIECPWRFEGDDVVFGKIAVYTNSDTRYYESITNYIKLHYSLESECFKEKK